MGQGEPGDPLLLTEEMRNGKFGMRERTSYIDKHRSRVKSGRRSEAAIVRRKQERKDKRAARRRCYRRIRSSFNHEDQGRGTLDHCFKKEDPATIPKKG
eukprot:13906443-Alexandrium_andersonii.AAC.1